MTLALVVAVAWPPLWAVILPRLAARLAMRSRPDPFPLGWLCAGAGDLLAAALARDPAASAVSAGQVLIALAIWRWRKRKDRRRALAAWGARELARLAAMVAALRERARPGPVLRPGQVPS